MKQQIIDHINDPDMLEELYRQDKEEFARCFSAVLDQYDTELVRFWKIRLAPVPVKEILGFRWRDVAPAFFLSLLTALLALIPAVVPGINRELFYLRDLPVIAFNGIILYSIWLNRKQGLKTMIPYGILLIALVVYINLLPDDNHDTVMIAVLHVPLFLWCCFGLAFLSSGYRNAADRMGFVRFTGELIIMTGLILLAGGLLSVITFAMFSVLKMDIVEFYTNFIAIPGGAASPVVAYFLIRSYPDITRKIAPVIAKIFTPVVLITLAVYLVSLIFSESRLLENREALIIFNVMLLGVLALIIFSISEMEKGKSVGRTAILLFSLSVLAIVINSIALVVIISRLFDGLTPNRIVVIITNLLVFTNLILLAINLYRSAFKGASPDPIEKTAGRYLTVYALWTVIAIFIIPALFRFL